MNRHLNRGKSGERGFTLLEILVGLLISSGIMVGLSLTMRAINSGWEAATAAIEKQAAFGTGLGVVAGDLARAVRRIGNVGNVPGFLFSGGSTSVVYLLAERPVNEKQGLYWVRLHVRLRDGQNELVREVAPFLPESDSASTIEWRHEVILLRGPFSFAFEYRAPLAGKPSWGAPWTNTDFLPEDIRITVTDLATGAAVVPPITQSLKIGAEADCVIVEAPGCTLRSNGVLSSKVSRQDG